MALKVLMLRKRLTDTRKALEALTAKDADFERREAELEKSIEEAETDEERAAVEEAVTEYETEKAAHEEEKKTLERKIEEIEGGISEEEREQETEPTPEEREVKKDMEKRNLFEGMAHPEKAAMFEREDVKNYLAEVRTCIREKRALTNVGLTIPEILLGVLRQNIEQYSKLYKHVNVRKISGTGREIIMGGFPEAIWTECCAALNELSLGFNDVEVDCYKVGGYFQICNATLEDSDIDLANEILTAIGVSIGYALDKAILYGKNTSGNSKMPLGVVSRLAQTSEPASYPATARPWVDYHSTHMLTIADTVTGIDLFKTILLDAAVISNKYSKSEKVWVMNETTYAFLQGQAMSINAAGAIVSGMNNTMPVIGGTVELLEFIPNYVIIGGHFDLYLLAERAGEKFAQSEHVAFLQDKTTFKGTARYDGVPVIAEAFAAIGVNGTTPDATMSFAADTANTAPDPVAIVLNTVAATVKNTKTLQLKATLIPEGATGTVTWASSDTTKATVSTAGLVTGKADSGSAVITATCGSVSAVCNITCAANA